MRTQFLRAYAIMALLVCIAGAWAQSTDSEPSQSIATRKKQAAAGDVKAQYSLGMLYHKGFGFGEPRNDGQAAVWFRKAADQGSADAQLELGWLYDEGSGMQRDHTKAMMWYRRAAEQGLASAQYQLADSYAETEDWPQAVLWYTKAAEQGHALAQYTLGSAYDFGEVLPHDRTKALSWLKRAAEQGYSFAQWRLGLLYEYPPGDYAQAALWERKAAEQGLKYAQCELGVFYDLGLGVPKDPTLAAVWYSKSKKQGKGSAGCEDGGWLLSGYLGDGVPDDPTERATQKEYDEAAADLRKDADQGLAFAQNKLGILYDLGLGVPQDFGMAVSLYSKAAEQGFPRRNTNSDGCTLMATACQRTLRKPTFGSIWPQ